MSQVRLITQTLFDEIADRAAASPRLRMNYNFHSGPADNPHRFLNVLLRGTYIRPHRHLFPPKAETFLVLEGEAEVIVFDGNGSIEARHYLGPESAEGPVWGIDIPPGIWHTVLARTGRAVCFEVKPGPSEPASDKEFAAWAPAEGDPAVEEYLRELLER